MNGRTAFGLLIFGIAAVVSFYINRGGGPPPAPDQTDLPEGYYLKGVSLRGTDALGEVQYTLRAERIDHHPADGSIELNNIALDYGNADKPWLMRAQHGRMPQSSNEISLSGNVEVENDHLNSTGRTTIVSDTLQVDIDNQIARTEDQVVISVGRGNIQGVGMEVNFANEQVSLLSEVSGVFDPPPK